VTAVITVVSGYCHCSVSGGVREAFFSNEYYNLVWGKRTGFAKVATEAQVVSCILYSCWHLLLYRMSVWYYFSLEKSTTFH